MGTKVAAGADAGVGGAGKVHGSDFLDRVLDGVFEFFDFVFTDVKALAVEGTGFVRLDEIDDSIGDFVAE